MIRNNQKIILQKESKNQANPARDLYKEVSSQHEK